LREIVERANASTRQRYASALAQLPHIALANGLAPKSEPEVERLARRLGRRLLIAKRVQIAKRRPVAPRQITTVATTPRAHARTPRRSRTAATGAKARGSDDGSGSPAPTVAVASESAVAVNLPPPDPDALATVAREWGERLFAAALAKVR